MPPKIDLSNKTFGILIVISESITRRPSGGLIWNCRCGCGNETKIRGSDLISGHTQSCGCKHGNHKHGFAKTKKTALYKTWISMRGRCENPKSTSFKYYGGRGISVCDRWKSFRNFLLDMGASFIESLEIDRINVNGNYEPSNCRWVTSAQQAQNKRNNRFVYFQGQMICAAECARRIGMKPNTLIRKLNRGWLPEMPEATP